jgi:hypothetical protein
MEKSLVIGASGLVAPSLLSKVQANSRMIKDDISLVQWALVDEVRSGKWKTLDFPPFSQRRFWY